MTDSLANYFGLIFLVLLGGLAAYLLDLKRWANATAWNLDDESKVEIWDVKYDFDDEDITEGDYPITFSTQGRELKIETTDHYEEGQRIGLNFSPEDIHVMRKMG